MTKRIDKIDFSDFSVDPHDPLGFRRLSERIASLRGVRHIYTIPVNTLKSRVYT